MLAFFNFRSNKTRDERYYCYTCNNYRLLLSQCPNHQSVLLDVFRDASFWTFNICHSRRRIVYVIIITIDVFFFWSSWIHIIARWNVLIAFGKKCCLLIPAWYLTPFKSDQDKSLSTYSSIFFDLSYEFSLIILILLHIICSYETSVLIQFRYGLRCWRFDKLIGACKPDRRRPRCILMLKLSD